jgi:steroid delta-isomerase-like uncharacterized protein
MSTTDPERQIHKFFRMMHGPRALAGIFVCALAAGACAHEPPLQPAAMPVCAPARSPVEANKALTARFFDEVFARKNPDAVMTLVAPDLVNHAAIPEAQGAEGMRGIVRKLLTAFPDATVSVEDVVAEGDRVVARTIFEGTQTAPLEFKNPLPATGKHARVEHVHTFRIRDGRIVEMWMTMDRLDMLRQLGLLPAPSH